MSEQKSAAHPSCFPSLGDVCGECHRCTPSEQTTPRTVEEAKRKVLTDAYNVLTDNPAPEQIDETLVTVYEAGRQAARMPSVDADAIAAVLYEADHPTRLDGWAGAPEWKRRAYLVKAERVVALWGAEPGREER